MTKKGTKKVKKVIRNGKIAVAISPGFGAGWSTWNEISPFEPEVIKMIEEGRQSEITTEWCLKELGIKGQYCGGADDLQIVWIPQGVSFSIGEYDGSEIIYRSDDLKYVA